MEFWRGRLQKSGSDQWEDFDNVQDILDLQERMRKHDFDGGPGINKDRWTYNDEIFDFDRPSGPAAPIWKIGDEKYKRLVELLDKLDAEDGDMTKLNPNIINGTLAGDPYHINDTVEVDDDIIKEQHVALNELLGYLKNVNAPKKVISNVLSLNGEYTDDYVEEDLYTTYDIIKDFLTGINADKKYFDYLETLFI